MSTILIDLAGQRQCDHHVCPAVGEDVLRAGGAELSIVTDAEDTSSVSALRERLHRAFDSDLPQQAWTATPRES